eukprot:CAMPEP_0177717718 /NCGR_PEP_ID=MMETSP0484_2-20121128/15193_1 /TAXON_ID=354590 /ORGANISM="Rhodomonas lens, Strain RHODO" /LENGTH=207 /DNA_ID=CAMNT_0019229835 /DNA_START=33 /DNA_END=656 /DNA_ORIENTATION=-
MSGFIEMLLEPIRAMSPIVGSIAMFVLISFCTCSAVITTTPLNFAVGALYGIVPGALLMDVACTTGSVINFLIGRYVARDWARRKLQESPVLSALEKALNKRAFFMLTLARLSPVFPFAMLGYALGATSVELSLFAQTTFVGMLPGCFLYSWIGVSMQEMSGDGGGGWSSWLSIGMSVGSTLLISWQAKKVFDEAMKEGKGGANKAV